LYTCPQPAAPTCRNHLTKIAFSRYLCQPHLLSAVNGVHGSRIIE
jgi:hypothetical protein